MALAEHLHPKTYWEERCELLEDSVFRMMSIIATHGLTESGSYALREHVADWNRLIGQIGDRHPPKQGNDND